MSQLLLFISYAIVVYCLLAAGMAQAQQSRWHWHGFASQGFVKTDHNSFFGDSQEGSWDFTDLGLGISYKASPKLQVSAQALYRNAGPNSPDGIVLDYGHIDLQAINTLDFGLGLRAGPGDIFSQGHIQSELGLASIEYNIGDLQLVGEYQRRDIDYHDIFYTGYASTLPSESWYLQGLWNISNKWQTVLRYDDYILNMNDPNGEQLEQQFANTATPWPASEGFGKDWTLGVRYTFNAHWHLAVEYHKIDGTIWIARPENPVPSYIVEQWQLFTAQVGFRF